MKPPFWEPKSNRPRFFVVNFSLAAPKSRQKSSQTSRSKDSWMCGADGNTKPVRTSSQNSMYQRPRSSLCAWRGYPTPSAQSLEGLEPET